MPRTVKEWVGRTDDAMPPPRVRLRIFDRENGICHICQQRIQTGQKWEPDHDPALINGGQNRESMMFPVHKTCHAIKTKADVAEKAKVQRTRAKDVGAIKPKGRIKSAGFQKKERAEKLPVPEPRRLFR